jgi:hypothetical protein
MSISDNRGSTYAGIIGNASNIRVGSNPTFLLTDLYVFYPQFGPDKNGDLLIPELIMQMYIDLANACIKEARWHSHWKIAMGWFVAHFLTLYLQGTANPDSGAGAVIAAGQAKGLNVSEAVADVSVSMDYNSIGQDLEGWAAWKLTIYGQQLATTGKLLGRGGMYVY